MSKSMDNCQELLGTLTAAEAYLRVFASMQLDFGTVVKVEQNAIKAARHLLNQLDLPEPLVGAGAVLSRDDATDEILTSAVHAEARGEPLDDGPEGVADDTAPLLSDERPAPQGPQQAEEATEDASPAAQLDLPEPELLELEIDEEITLDGPEEEEEDITVPITRVDIESALTEASSDDFDLIAEESAETEASADEEATQVANVTELDSMMEELSSLPSEDIQDDPSANEVIIAKHGYKEGETEAHKSPQADVPMDDDSAEESVEEPPRRSSRTPPKRERAKGPKVSLATPRAAPTPRPSARTFPKDLPITTSATPRPSKGRMAGLYAGSSNVPTIRDRKDRPSAAAIQIGPSGNKGGGAPKATVLGHDEDDVPIALGDPEEYGMEGDEEDSSASFGISVEEYEDDIELEEEIEEFDDDDVALEPAEPEMPSDAEVARMFAKAKATLDNGDMHSAIDLFSDVLDADPEYANAYVLRGRIYLDLGDYARAMSDFTIAEEEAPNSPEPQVAIGDLYFARKDYRKAIEYFDAALRMEQDHAMAFCRRGISHYYRKNYREALTDLNRAKALAPDIPNIRTYISMAKKKARR